MRRWALLLVATLFVASVGVLSPTAVQADVSLTVDGSSTTGRTFQGIGGISAGSSARLLADYPASAQSQIYDYLFKPNFGASLQRLKVEIGSDINSTWGSEPGVRRAGESAPGSTSDSVQCRRGSEFNLMKAAASRNSSIAFDSLEWGAPSWVGGTTQNFWSQDNANYVNDFMDCAAEPQNQVGGSAMSFSTTGLWNETPWATTCGADGVNYVKNTLYSTLSTRATSRGQSPAPVIVAADGAGGCGDTTNFDIANNINADPTNLGTKIKYLGSHYNDSSTSTAEGLLASTGQYLWSTEDENDPTTAAFTAAMLNRNYLVGKETATLTCCLVDGYYSSIYHSTGMITTNTPWGAGGYTVLPQLWAIAHTTQFTQPGWQYLDNATTCLPTSSTDCALPYVSGREAMDCTQTSSTGSVATLKGTGTNPDVSMVVETNCATTTQNLNVTLQNVHSLACGCVHVWKSDFSGGTYFVQQSDLTVTNGTFTLAAAPNALYTVTTTTGQSKGSYAAPASSTFPFPWSDNYEGAGAVATVNTLDSAYNNWDGKIGMEYQTGAGGLTLTQLGRYFVTGNNLSHTMSVYLDSNRTQVGTSCTINAATAKVYGGFQYCAPSSPITLAANTKYDIMSSEANNGDTWYYYPNTTVSVSVGSVLMGVVEDSGGTWYNNGGGAGHTYGPVNFTTVGGRPLYLSDQQGAFEVQHCDGGRAGNCVEQVVDNKPIAWGAEGDVVGNNTLGTARNNFTGPVGMQYTTGPNGLTVTALGRIYYSGNTGSHTVTVYRDSDKANLGSCSVAEGSGSADAAGFKYCTLSSPLSLAPNTAYEVVSTETTNGDYWYDSDTTVSSSEGTVNQAAYRYNGTWYFGGTTGNSYGPVTLAGNPSYDGSSPETVLYKSSPVDAPTASAGSGGSLAVGTYQLEYTYVTASGETDPSPASDGIALTSGHQNLSVAAMTPLPAWATAVKWYFASGPTTGYTVQNNGAAFTLNTAGNGTAPATSDYTFESSVLFEEAGAASLIGRATPGIATPNYYAFTVGTDGTCALTSTTGLNRSCTITAPPTGTWHTMEINFSGSTTKVYFDNTTTPILTVSNDPSPILNGPGVGFVTGWNKVQFSNSCWKASVGSC